jgi:hypothetical protein
LCDKTHRGLTNHGNTTDTVCIHTVLGHLLPSIQPQFSEWTSTSFEQSIAEFYTILLEEHLKVALAMLEVGICSSL